VYAELGFFLNGRLLSPGGIVSLSEIEEGSSALYCLTNRELCCSSEAGQSRGAWRFPNNLGVGEDTTADIYFTRGFSSLLLNRRSSAVGPTGVYTCLIPDAGDVLRTLTVAITDGESYNCQAGDCINCADSANNHGHGCASFLKS
jgi:hypothetical protein